MKIGYVIAIDGPSGAGKSTVARELANKLGYRYIDTGAMYRAAALAADRERVDPNDAAELARFLSRLEIRQEMSGGNVITLLGGDDVSEAIRRGDMGLKASAISALPPVRERLTALQREMGRQGGVVMEGRDIGTVVFPDADYKFFVTASAEERARRRHEELKQKGEHIDFATVLADIKKRDHDDSTRAVAPLKSAPGAIEIETTTQSVERVVDEIARRLAAKRRDENV
ncbi:MAG TPA: (d)CMP kinase [bacterium]|nr:(d)CMP kinase [bacterium]